MAPRCVDGPVHLAGLFIHPVKSLRACAVASANVDALGLVGDRRFLVVDAAGRFLMQRTLPRLACIVTALSADTLTLSAEGAVDLRVPRAPDPAAPLRTVGIWQSDGLLAEDCGAAPAGWLGDFLGVECRLVRIGAAFQRPMLKPGVTRPGDVVGFADAYPFLVISEASLAALNDRLVARGEDAIPMNRFRPNLVVSGAPAFAEDTWSRVRIGDLVLRAGGPCSRCVITTTDQITGERGREPLSLLATYRRDAADPTNVNFGQHFIHEPKTGTVRVADPVEVL